MSSNTTIIHWLEGPVMGSLWKKGDKQIYIFGDEHVIRIGCTPGKGRVGRLEHALAQVDSTKKVDMFIEQVVYPFIEKGQEDTMTFVSRSYLDLLHVSLMGCWRQPSCDTSCYFPNLRYHPIDIRQKNDTLREISDYAYGRAGTVSKQNVLKRIRSFFPVSLLSGSVWEYMKHSLGCVDKKYEAICISPKWKRKAQQMKLHDAIKNTKSLSRFLSIWAHLSLEMMDWCIIDNLTRPRTNHGVVFVGWVHAIHLETILTEMGFEKIWASPRLPGRKEPLEMNHYLDISGLRQPFFS